MDTPPIKKRHRRCRRSNASSPILLLPDDLIVEILFILSIKDILRLKCVSKFWNTFISDPTFVQRHLKISSQNPHLIITPPSSWKHFRPEYFSVEPFPVHLLLKNPSIITVSSNNVHRLSSSYMVVGSCNGLLCLLFHSLRETFHSLRKTPTITIKNWFRFWNPATRTRSKRIGLLCYSTPHGSDITARLSHYKYAFGYDASTKTYKIVAFCVKKNKGKVKVFSLGNNCWRNIQSLPVLPLNWLKHRRRLCSLNDGVHLSGTINWLAMYKPNSNTHVQFVIVSLDLSTESYKQLQPPPGFNEVPFFQPVLRVLMDGLCLSHDSKKTEFVLWHMKEYGVQESWTQLFKISYKNLQMHNIGDGLACLYVNSDVVILANEFRNGAFIYNLKDKTVERITTSDGAQWFSQAKDYVESLVSVR